MKTILLTKERIVFVQIEVFSKVYTLIDLKLLLLYGESADWRGVYFNY